MLECRFGQALHLEDEDGRNLRRSNHPLGLLDESDRQLAPERDNNNKQRWLFHLVRIQSIHLRNILKLKKIQWTHSIILSLLFTTTMIIISNFRLSPQITMNSIYDHREEYLTMNSLIPSQKAAKGSLMVYSSNVQSWGYPACPMEAIHNGMNRVKIQSFIWWTVQSVIAENHSDPRRSIEKEMSLSI